MISPSSVITMDTFRLMLRMQNPIMNQKQSDLQTTLVKLLSIRMYLTQMILELLVFLIQKSFKAIGKKRELKMTVNEFAVKRHIR